KMKDELSKLKEKVETVTTATVDGMVKKVISYASRPVTEFNKHEVVEMMETLYHTAHDRSDTKEGYFRLAYHTIRGKIELPKEQLRHLVLRMVGDKDHERIFDIVAKVEKQSMQSIGWLWERNDLFDERMMVYSKNRIQNQVKWLDSRGSPVEAGGEMTAEEGLRGKVYLVECGEMIGNLISTRVNYMSGEYSMLECEEERRKKVAGSALFLVVYYLVRLGYFLGLAKSTLIPSKRVPYLGFLVDSSTEAFHLIPRKKLKLLNLVQEILQGSVVSVDAWVDNQAVIQAWNHLGCRSVELNNAMKNLFYAYLRI
ncbi:hypothetical protein QZH41_014291, partial [Actinostola sp. cb2023]